MDTPLAIRPFEEEDFQTFDRLRKEALLNTPESHGSDYESYDALSYLDKEHLFEKLLNYPFNYALGAFVDNTKAVGMTGFSCRHQNPMLRHKGYIWGMYVSPDARGKGIASQMLDSIVTSASEDISCEQLLLTVSSDNTDALKLYRTSGFIPYGTEFRALKIDPNSYIDEILMIRLL